MLVVSAIRPCRAGGEVASSRCLVSHEHSGGIDVAAGAKVSWLFSRVGSVMIVLAPITRQPEDDQFQIQEEMQPECVIAVSPKTELRSMF